MMKKALAVIAFLSLVLLTASPGLPAPALEEGLAAVSAGDAKETSIAAKELIVIKYQIVKIAGHDNEDILAMSVINCENGKKASLRFDSQPGFSYILELIPEIIEGKDIRLKVSARAEPGMDEPFQRELLVKSNSSVSIELFQNKKDDSRIMVDITPSIQTVVPAREYPQAVTDLDWGETMVLFNDRLVARGTIDARNATGFYMRFWKSGHFLFSFHHFPGAEPLGLCEGNWVKFRLDKGETIEWFSAKPPLPQGKWLVWCAYKPDIGNEASDNYMALELMKRAGMTKEGEIGIWRLKDPAGELPSAVATGPLDEKMNFEFKNGSMKMILEFVAKTLNARLSLDPKLNEKKLTLEFYQVPLRQFLDFVCKMNYAKWQFTKGEPSILRVEIQ
jgi:hypothetical protein